MHTPPSLPPLNQVLAYQNPLVIKRFKRNYPHYHSSVELLFKDMLSYLWLCRKFEADKTDPNLTSKMQFTLVMHKEMQMIDEMWHTFILITKDYAEFCQTHFGSFIHHVPEVGEEATDQDIVLDEFEQELENFLAYVYANLGEATVRRWFSVYLD